jgi:hypothetical protein
MRWSEFGAAHLPGLALAATLGVATWVLAGWLRVLHVAPLALLMEVALFVAAASLALCWSLPPLFLGRDARSLLRTLIAVIPERLQCRPLGRTP